MNLAGTRSSLSIAVDSQEPSRIFQVLPAGSSISGAQEKSLFRMQRGRFLPEIPSTHIIKPDGDYPEMPANEHLTMTIARRAKFPVPWTGLFRVDGLGLVYVVKRFDRLPKEGRILLEDFAQILSYMESDKEDGSMEEIAAGIERFCSSPVIEKGEFLRRILFSFVFCNGDMHLKNWSLAYDPVNRLYKLSPVYDWLNVRASMPRDKVEMILPLGGKRTGLERRDFEAFSKDVLKLGSKFVGNCFADIPKWLKIAEELCPVSALSDPMKRKYLELVQSRVSRVL